MFKDHSVSEDHEINISNCSNSSIARIKLEKYLIKKYDNFYKLIVDKCVEMNNNSNNKLFDNPFNNPFNNNNSFNNIFGQFGDIFNKK
jgi:hypothetical protein